MAEANGNGTARVGLWVSITGAVVAVLIFIGSLMTMYAQLVATERTADDLKERVDRMALEIASQRVQIVTLTASQTEIDTQLRASIDDDNKSLAWQLRIDAMLWEKSFDGKSHLPIDNAFYPNIANGQSR